MKKNLILSLFIALIISIPFCSYAQTTKHNLYAGYGLATAPDLVNGWGGLTSTLASFGVVTVVNPEYTGSIFVGYSNNVTSKLSVDLKASYQRYRSQIYALGVPIGSQQENYYTVLGGIKYEYGTIGLVTIYSGAALGAFINNDKETYGTETTDKTNTFLGYQFTALGVRTNGTLSAFIEGGFGHIGMIAGGASYKF